MDPAAVSSPQHRSDVLTSSVPFDVLAMMAQQNFIPGVDCPAGHAAAAEGTAPRTEGADGGAGSVADCATVDVSPQTQPVEGSAAPDRTELAVERAPSPEAQDEGMGEPSPPAVQRVEVERAPSPEVNAPVGAIGAGQQAEQGGTAEEAPMDAEEPRQQGAQESTEERANEGRVEETKEGDIKEMETEAEETKGEGAKEEEETKEAGVAKEEEAKEVETEEPGDARPAPGRGESPAPPAPEAGEAEGSKRPAPASGAPTQSNAKRARRAGTQESADYYYDAMRAVPAGESRTFTEVARVAGNPRGARVAGRLAAGLALEDRDVPWWRVVGADGRLATAPDRREAQLDRLREEGARPREGESVADWAARVGAAVVGAYTLGSKHHFHLPVDDERLQVSVVS